MRLSDWEKRELDRLARALERDDPLLARRLRTMAIEPASPTGMATFVLITTSIGFLLIGLGVRLNLDVCQVFGVLFATCVPLVGSVWLNTRDRRW